MIAVILVRDGALPAGFDEAICEADRRVLLVGSNVADSLDDVGRFARIIWTLEIDPARTPFATTASLVADQLHHIWDDNSGLADNALPGTKDVTTTESGISEARSRNAGESVLLPSSPDGRDLAPHLAFVLGVPLHAGAMSVSDNAVTVARRGGLFLSDVHPQSPFVATFQIGVRGADPRTDADRTGAKIVELTPTSTTQSPVLEYSVEHIEIQPPDASTMDLAEAPRILGGGAGLTDSEAFDQLQRVAARLGASMGVTRVITDRGWADHNRQIGTTGVVVDPNLYISFGISGAVQHTSGLGHPDHIISVNTDAHCPMMQISDVAIVADANDVLDALESLLDESGDAS